MTSSTDSNQSICDPCRFMFSTIRNLCALSSEAGYRHGILYGKDKDWRCALCGHIYLIARMHGHSSDKYTLLCFASRQGSPIWSQPTSFSACPAAAGLGNYPKDILQIDSIVFRWVDEFGEHCGMTGPRADNFLLRFSVLEGDPYNDTLNCPTPSDNGLSVELIPRLLSHLQQCLQGHEKCSSEITHPLVLPKRLIDLECLGPSAVKLYVPAKDEHLEYAALSYCWGREGNVTTTMKNLPENTKGIYLNSLPCTIQDAVAVCRLSKIRYLWIDALCIIQDNEDDKLSEIQRMGAIYNGSKMTIAAAAAPSVREGFLSFLPPLHGDPEKIRFLLPDGRFGTVFGKLHTHSGEISPSRGTVTLPYESGALDERGWALQEHLLSPRLLIFAKHHVIWCCQSLRPISLLEPHIQYKNQLPRMPRAATIDIPPREIDERILSFWREVVEDYSQRNFTRVDDRPLGLVGIVNELRPIWNDTYHYGIWEKSFLGLLCWNKRISCHGLAHDDRLVRQKSLSSFPSWSWLAVGYGVVYPRNWPLVENDGHWWYHLPSARILKIEDRVLVLRARALVQPPPDFTQQPSEWLFRRAFDKPADFQHLADCHMLCMIASGHCLSVMLLHRDTNSQRLDGAPLPQKHATSGNGDGSVQAPFRRVGCLTIPWIGPDGYSEGQFVPNFVSAFGNAQEMVYNIV